MVLMYVPSQTVPESAIEDDGSKDQKCNHVLEIYEIKYYRIFFNRMIYVE